MRNDEVLKKIKGGLIVSCQALVGEPLYVKKGGIMSLMAKAAFEAGAVGIRTNGINDVKDIKKIVPLPIIAIIKQSYEGYGAYITPTMKEVDELFNEGAEIIAVDATSLSRPGYDDTLSYLMAIRTKYPNQLLMADCSCLDDAINAEKAGFDFVGTTMSGYVEGQTVTEGPDYELAKSIVDSIKIPLIAEGRIHYPSEARKMLELGAYAVVVGGAITRPKEITERFVAEIKKVER